MFKHALKTLLDDFGLLSKDVAEMLIQMYQVNPCPAILDLAKQVWLYMYFIIYICSMCFLFLWSVHFVIFSDNFIGKFLSGINLWLH